MDADVTPLKKDEVRSLARSICRSHDFDAVIVIGVRAERLHLGSYGHGSDAHAREILCTAIYGTFGDTAHMLSDERDDEETDQ